MTGKYLPPQNVWQIFAKLLPLSMFSTNSHVQIAIAKSLANICQTFCGGKLANWQSFFVRHLKPLLYYGG
jgi:hypothetical protein